MSTVGMRVQHALQHALQLALQHALQHATHTATHTVVDCCGVRIPKTINFDGCVAGSAGKPTQLLNADQLDKSTMYVNSRIYVNCWNSCALLNLVLLKFLGQRYRLAKMRWMC